MTLWTDNRSPFFIATAVAEAGANVCLLILPATATSLLLGVSRPAAEAMFVGRVAGAALLAISVASWIARGSGRCPAQIGLLMGLLFYNVTVAGLLAYAGAELASTGFFSVAGGGHSRVARGMVSRLLFPGT